MKVDAPAVSRIEAGARGVRLSEAYLIADILRVPIRSLLPSQDTPEATFWFRDMTARGSLDALRNSIIEWVSDVAATQDILRAHPNAADKLVAETGDASITADTYIHHLVSGSASHDAQPGYAWPASAADRAELVAAVTSIVTDVVSAVAAPIVTDTDIPRELLVDHETSESRPHRIVAPDAAFTDADLSYVDFDSPSFPKDDHGERQAEA